MSTQLLTRLSDRATGNGAISSKMLNIFQGSKIRLRGVEPGDWERFFTWNDDSEAGRASWFIAHPVSSAFVKKWTEEQATAAPKNDEYRLVIETLPSETGGPEMVGTLNIHSCEPRNGTFKYGIALVREHWRKGYASEAIRLVLGYYFNELRYQKCTVHIYEFNQPSVKLHEALGFQHEGRVRSMIYTEGKYWDEFVMGVTKTEWFNMK